MFHYLLSAHLIPQAQAGSAGQVRGNLCVSTLMGSWPGKNKLIPKVEHVCSYTLEIYPTWTNKMTNQTKSELRKANFLITRAGRTAGGQAQDT